MPWDKPQTGTTETSTGEDTVTFKDNRNSDGTITDTIISRGEKITDDHAHAWDQNTSSPGHRNDTTGVLNDGGDASQPPRK